MPWTSRDIPDQQGRIAVVTGANGGLGLVTARELAAHGAHVVMAVRNLAKADAAVAEMRACVPDASLELVALDLSSQASTKDAATTILAAHPRVDLLVNNAGVMGIPESRTVDGYEMQLGVDHLGHWTLTALLLPALLRTPGSRIVTVTSTAHHIGRALDPDNPHLVGTYGAWKSYGQAKLANFHFGLGLQRELERVGAATASLIAHPGLSDTDLQAVSVEQSDGEFWSRVFHFLSTRTGMSADEGALSQLRAATDPAASGGEFYGPLLVNTGRPVRKPVLRRLGLSKAIATLWEVSERETGVAMDMTTLES